MGVDFDPPLTAKGKHQAFKSGELIRDKMLVSAVDIESDKGQLLGWNGADVS